MRLVTVMRGLPGAGKTTWAKRNLGKTTWTKRNLEGGVIVSADDYFVCDDGVFRYRPAELAEAHADCFRKFLKALVDDIAHVIVDNTNMTLWHCSPYMLAAAAFGYQAELVLVGSLNPDENFKSVHNVPDARVKEMAAQYEPPLPFWTEYIGRLP